MISLSDIDQERSVILTNVLSTVLRSAIVKNVFAQVIDGLPIRSMYEIISTCRSELLSRNEPSEQSRLLSGRFCDKPEDIFSSLSLNPTVAQLYQDSVLYSPHFNMHLLELAATAIHDIAGNLYATFHPNGEPERSQPGLVSFRNSISLSTRLYSFSSRYPRGAVDVVGYWAETHIFGGVVVFDRGQDSQARHCYGAYIHPRPCGQLFQLSEAQLRGLSRLGSEENVDLGQFPLPFAPEPDAKTVHHVTAFQDLNIYRDRYERYIPVPRGGGPCVVRLEDHPELVEFHKQARKMFEDP
ncbi:hypothetical protein FQN54_009420 [Arachnomyces sp. PD_36]|nr:hypothetical protein FQN54_009420 [Arachnomyces sp. PD_36]